MNIDEIKIVQAIESMTDHLITSLGEVVEVLATMHVEIEKIRICLGYDGQCNKDCDQ